MRFTLKRIETLIKQALKEQPTGDDWLDSRYNEQVHWVGHTQPYYKLFYLLSGALKPKIVVELGGWQGTAPAHFAAGYPEAMVITIDHHSDPGDDAHQARMLEVVNHYRVNYLQGWTAPGYEEEYHKGIGSVYEQVKWLLGDEKIDILFIDSWHEGRYLKRDWDYYSPLLANPALVICDDIYNGEHFTEMVETFEALPGQKLLNDEVHRGVPMGFIKYELPKSRGTGQKKPAAAKRSKARKS